jgi:hypothetical protein
MAYRAALGEPVKSMTTYPVDRTCVFPLHDFGACLRLVRQGQLTPFAWARSWLTSKHTIFSLRDPLPYVYFYGTSALGFVHRRMVRAHHRLWPRRTAAAPLSPASEPVETS